MSHQPGDQRRGHQHVEQQVVQVAQQALQNARRLGLVEPIRPVAEQSFPCLLVRQASAGGVQFQQGLLGRTSVPAGRLGLLFGHWVLRGG